MSQISKTELYTKYPNLQNNEKLENVKDMLYILDFTIKNEPQILTIGCAQISTDEVKPKFKEAKYTISNYSNAIKINKANGKFKQNAVITTSVEINKKTEQNSNQEIIDVELSGDTSITMPVVVVY